MYSFCSSCFGLDTWLVFLPLVSPNSGMRSTSSWFISPDFPYHDTPLLRTFQEPFLSRHNPTHLVWHPRISTRCPNLPTCPASPPTSSFTNSLFSVMGWLSPHKTTTSQPPVHLLPQFPLLRRPVGLRFWFYPSFRDLAPSPASPGSLSDHLVPEKRGFLEEHSRSDFYTFSLISPVIPYFLIGLISVSLPLVCSYLIHISFITFHVLKV